jgi:hypothetical protein
LTLSYFLRLIPVIALKLRLSSPLLSSPTNPSIMYSTKRYHNKTLGPEEGFLNIGVPYVSSAANPFVLDNRSRGKQVITNPGKKGQTAGYFNKFDYTVEKYQGESLFWIVSKSFFLLFFYHSLFFSHIFCSQNNIIFLQLYSFSLCSLFFLR